MISPYRLLAVAIVCALPWTAQAQQRQGAYLNLGGGVSLAHDSDFDGTGIATSSDFDPGFAVNVGLGYAYGNGVRVELDFGYANPSVGEIDGAASPEGDASATSFMLNGYYDFINESQFTPYLGAGIGTAIVDFDGVRPIGGSQIDDDDTVFAYQAIAGIAYRANDHIDLFTEYRYLGTTDSSLSTVAGASVDSEYRDHRFLIGLR